MLLRGWLASLFQVDRRRLRKGRPQNRRKPVHLPVEVQQLETRMLLSSVQAALLVVITESNSSVAGTVSAFNNRANDRFVVDQLYGGG
jgi:hypothetical protein